METAKKLFTTKRRVKLLVQGKTWEEVEVPVVLGGKLPAVITMGEKIFTRHGEEFRECSSNEFYRAPLPYFVGING